MFSAVPTLAKGKRALVTLLKAAGKPLRRWARWADGGAAMRLRKPGGDLRDSASELQTRVEALTRELEEARAEQAATAAVLRVIASSPTDIQPVLDGVVASAAKLCNSYMLQRAYWRHASQTWPGNLDIGPTTAEWSALPAVGTGEAPFDFRYEAADTCRRLAKPDTQEANPSFAVCSITHYRL